MYTTGRFEDLKRIFPARTPKAIRAAAWLRNFQIPDRPFKKSGIALVDSVMERAFELRYTRIDLDAMCDSGQYFRNSGWRRGPAHHGFLLRAVKELGGHVEAVWDDDQYD